MSRTSQMCFLNKYIFLLKGYMIVVVFEFFHNLFYFTGCKIALFCDDRILTILRDDKDNIPWPNMWELPGGGREGNENPFECAAREVYEELGIHLTEDCLIWAKVYPSMLYEGRHSVFMVGQISQEQFESIVFGDEGQGYQLMNVEEFLKSKQAVPQLQGRLKDYLKESE